MFTVLWRFFVLGLYSFGGPAAHIGYFQREFVQDKKWLTDQDFTHAVALCQFLPGPASSQLGMYIGYKKKLVTLVLPPLLSDLLFLRFYS